MTSNIDFFDFVDEYAAVGESYENTRHELQETLQHVAQAVNRRDIANYNTVTPLPSGVTNDDIGSPTGQNFFNDVFPTPLTDEQSTIFRPTLRKLVTFTNLQNAANPNTVAHRILGGTALTNAFVFTRIYGVVQDVTAGPLWVPIPNDNVHLEVNSTDVSMTIPALYNGYSGIVILEYITA